MIDVNAGLEPPNAPPREELLAFVQSFPSWYHRIYLGHGVYTLGSIGFHEVVWNRVKAAFPESLQGASMLDVGSNAGYFCLQAKLRHAGRVLGVEVWPDYLKQAEFIRRIWNADVEYRHMNAHKITDLTEKFDLVMFTGILYHLKNPLRVMEAIGRLCRDAVVLETEAIIEDPRNTVVVRWGAADQMRATACHKGMMKFVEGSELNGDPSNWWIPDAECVMGMLRTAGFTRFSAPIYLTENRLLLVASKQEQSLLDLEALTG